MSTINQTNQETYNRIANIYYAKHFSSNTLNPLMDMFIRLMNPCGKILDLGSGPGQCSKYFLEHGFQVTGIDFSKEFIKIAREKVINGNFIEADILKYPFEKVKYNGVWTSAVLLHFSSEQVAKLLERISESLEPKGILYLSFKEGEGERLFERIDRGIEDKRYFYDRSVDDVKFFIENANFELIDIARNVTGPVVFINCFARKR